MQQERIDSHRNFNALSIKDLLDAREAFHTHLVHLENVVATAIGMYRFIKKTSTYEGQASMDEPRGRDQVRTLTNSEIRKESVPCVMVFVDGWIKKADIAAHADELVPQKLHLPDGRVVPTCVIYTDKQMLPSTVKAFPRYPNYPIGGSFPVVSEVQGMTRSGTIGCIVNNGENYFALTTQHVASQPGAKVNTVCFGQIYEIGETYPRQTTCMNFDKAYPCFPGINTQLRLDAGLIKINDINDWTSQVYGMPEFAEVVDLQNSGLSLDLIGRPVQAWGASSCKINGEIQALFYRYQSAGGQEYITDFLISPVPTENDKQVTMEAERNNQHANSGSIWFITEERTSGTGKNQKIEMVYRPIALHLGGQRFVQANGTEITNFSLATALSTICHELDVDVVRDINTGLPEIWGAVGHYKIAEAAYQILNNKTQQDKLKQFIDMNIGNITYTRDQIANFTSPNVTGSFMPLADVPNHVWSKTRQYKQFVRPAEGMTHYANVDLVWDKYNKTLLQMCMKDKKNIDPQIWKDYFNEINQNRSQETQGGGVLPFRVWQLFDAMVEAVSRRKLDEFLLAAGVLTNYIGDACNSLHASWANTAVNPKYQARLLPMYDTDIYTTGTTRIDLFNMVQQNLRNTNLATIDKGSEAAFEVINLIDRSLESVPPARLQEIFDNSETAADAKRAIWAQYGNDIAKRFIEGSQLIASLWQSAWVKGGGESIEKSAIQIIKPEILETLYQNQNILPSVAIEKMRRKEEQLVTIQTTTSTTT